MKFTFIPSGLDSSPSQKDKKRLQSELKYSDPLPSTTKTVVPSEEFHHISQAARLLDGFCLN